MIELVDFRFLNFPNLLLEAKSAEDLLRIACNTLAMYAKNSQIAILGIDKTVNKFKVLVSVGYTDEALDKLNNLVIFEPNLFSLVLAKRTPVNSLNQKPLPDFNQKLMNIQDSSMEIVFPLLANEEIFGLVLIDSLTQDLVDEVKTLEVLISCLAKTMKLLTETELARQKALQWENLLKLKEIADKENLILDDYLDKALELVFQITQSNHGSILFAESEKLLLAAYRGFAQIEENFYGLEVNSMNAFSALNTLKPVINEFKLNHYYDYQKLIQTDKFVNVVNIPLSFDNLKLGVIELFIGNQDIVAKLDLNLLTKIGKIIGMALKSKYLTGNESLASLLCSKTGLLNQVHLKQLLTKEIKRSKRQGRSIGVLCLNIDHLGFINSHLGKQLADRAIDYVAQKIKIALRDIDLLFYTDNGEFVVILPETVQAHSLLVAERIKNMVREETCPSVGRITVSVGVASYNESGETSGELLQQSSQAMHMAKLEGRDKVKLLAGTHNLDSESWKQMSVNAKLSNFSEVQSQLPNRLESNIRKGSSSSKVNNFLAKQRVFKPKNP